MLLIVQDFHFDMVIYKFTNLFLSDHKGKCKCLSLKTK